MSNAEISSAPLFNSRFPQFRTASVKAFLFKCLASLKGKYSFRAIIIGVIIFALSVSAVFAAPKIQDYVAVNKLLKEAQNLENSGDYKAALASLTNADEKWTLSSKRVEVDRTKSRQEQNIKDQEIFDKALEREKLGKHAEARALLLSINTEFPRYKEVKDKLVGVQDKIEGKLQAEARAASSAKQAAERRAEAEGEAKRRAETEARFASEAKQRSDEQAAAAAHAAQEAEYQRQQEALRRSEEVKTSFRNQLTAAYNTFNSEATFYYDSAINYSNSGDSLLALTQAGKARAVLNSARNNIGDLNSRFSGMPSQYYTAANHMVSAIDNLLESCSLLITSEGTSLDYSSDINRYKNQALAYIDLVKRFLDNN